MTNITFDDNLITGNDTIDTQHEELISRIQQFVAACESGDSKVKAIKMLDYLDEYTNFHFQAEEELQKKVSYPELAKHQEKHDEFKKSIQELYDFLNENEGPNAQFIEQVRINVVDWLFKHIKTFDRSVAEYIHLNNNAERLYTPKVIRGANAPLITSLQIIQLSYPCTSSRISQMSTFRSNASSVHRILSW